MAARHSLYAPMALLQLLLTVTAAFRPLFLNHVSHCQSSVWLSASSSSIKHVHCSSKAHLQVFHDVHVNWHTSTGMKKKDIGASLRSNLSPWEHLRSHALGPVPPVLPANPPLVACLPCLAPAPCRWRQQQPQ